MTHLFIFEVMISSVFLIILNFCNAQHKKLKIKKSTNAYDCNSNVAFFIVTDERHTLQCKPIFGKSIIGLSWLVLVYPHWLPFQGQHEQSRFSLVEQCILLTHGTWINQDEDCCSCALAPRSCNTCHKMYLACCWGGERRYATVNTQSCESMAEHMIWQQRGCSPLIHLISWAENCKLILFPFGNRCLPQKEAMKRNPSPTTWWGAKQNRKTKYVKRNKPVHKWVVFVYVQYI